MSSSRRESCFYTAVTSVRTPSTSVWRPSTLPSSCSMPSFISATSVASALSSPFDFAMDRDLAPEFYHQDWPWNPCYIRNPFHHQRSAPPKERGSILVTEFYYQEKVSPATAPSYRPVLELVDRRRSSPCSRRRHTAEDR
ncbi:hypothetical protein VPH35_088405 [Triticum aestivum]